MKPEIAELVGYILDDEEFEEALMLGWSYRFKEDPLPIEKFFELDSKIGIPLPSHTKYPIEYRSIIRSIKYYCEYEIMTGIRVPRHFVSNACAHLESCAKLLLEKIESARYANAPLGPVLYRLSQLSVSRDLIVKTFGVNKLVYVRAKHDWNIPDGEHLFEADDAVMIYFAARKLAKQLLDERKIKIPMEEFER